MKFIPNKLSVSLARQMLVGKQHSPQVLFAAGLVGMGATIVLACRATLKVEAVLDDAQLGVSTIEEAERDVAHPEYNSEVARTDKVHLYGRVAVEFCKLYAPTVIVGGLSVAALAGSHNILSKRNAALIAAYGAIEKSLNEYRDRIRQEFGVDRERELYNDAQVCEIEDPETGKKVKVKRVGDNGPLSPYAKLFDRSNVNHSVDPVYNHLFLRSQQSYWNSRLQTKGHVFLNEVYDSLGLDRTPAGQVVGWVKDNGDSYVSFGIFDDDINDRVADFMMGREDSVWLDFNVDGVVYDLI